MNAQAPLHLQVPPGELPPAAGCYVPPFPDELDGATPGNITRVAAENPLAAAIGSAAFSLWWIFIAIGVFAVFGIVLTACGFFIAAGQTLWLALCGHIMPTLIDYN